MRNTGERKETYYLSGKFGFFDQDKIVLEPGEEKVVGYHINITKDIAEGIIEDTLTLKGAHMVNEKSLNLNVDVLKENLCSNFSVEVIPPEITADKYKGYLYKIKIKNNGYAKNTFRVKFKDDYGMIYLEPEEISMDSGDEGTIFMYVAPNSKMPNKEYIFEGEVIDKFGNERKFKAVFNLEAEKSNFAEGSEEDKIIVHVGGLDKEKVYYVSDKNITKLNITYEMEGKEEIEEILFTAGSFIIQIGDELYEDKNPEIGKKTYVIYANNKTYKITVKFVYVDNNKKEYKFKIEDITIEKEKKRLYPPEEEGKKARWWRSWRFWIPFIVLLVGILFIIYDAFLSYRKETSGDLKGERKKDIEKLKEVVEK